MNLEENNSPPVTNCAATTMRSPPIVMTSAQLSPKQIICGKGMQAVRHTANKHYRAKCASKQIEYKAALKKIAMKQKVTRRVYDELKADGYSFVRPVEGARNKYIVIHETETEVKLILEMIRQCIKDSNKRTRSADNTSIDTDAVVLTAFFIDENQNEFLGDIADDVDFQHTFAEFVLDHTTDMDLQQTLAEFPPNSYLGECTPVDQEIEHEDNRTPGVAE